MDRCYVKLVGVYYCKNCKSGCGYHYIYRKDIDLNLSARIAEKISE